jgi:hypothetical protein
MLGLPALATHMGVKLQLLVSYCYSLCAQGACFVLKVRWTPAAEHAMLGWSGGATSIRGVKDVGRAAAQHPCKAPAVA